MTGHPRKAKRGGQLNERTRHTGFIAQPILLATRKGRYFNKLLSPTMESYQADEPIGDLTIHAETPKGQAVFMQLYR